MEGQNETQPLQKVQNIYIFSPRANITALESAHLAALLFSVGRGADMEQHESWPVVVRHFELRQEPVVDEAVNEGKSEG